MHRSRLASRKRNKLYFYDTSCVGRIAAKIYFLVYWIIHRDCKNSSNAINFIAVILIISLIVALLYSVSHSFMSNITEDPSPR
jgi:hypothetical protein